jgi:DNA-directed RNA polymerase subunit RPC12/RpoP
MLEDNQYKCLKCKKTGSIKEFEDKTCPHCGSRHLRVKLGKNTEYGSLGGIDYTCLPCELCKKLKDVDIHHNPTPNATNEQIKQHFRNQNLTEWCHCPKLVCFDCQKEVQPGSYGVILPTKDLECGHLGGDGEKRCGSCYRKYAKPFEDHQSSCQKHYKKKQDNPNDPPTPKPPQQDKPEPTQDQNRQPDTQKTDEIPVAKIAIGIGIIVLAIVGGYLLFKMLSRKSRH